MLVCRDPRKKKVNFILTIETSNPRRKKEINECDMSTKRQEY